MHHGGSPAFGQFQIMSFFTRAPHTPAERAVSTRVLLRAEEEALIAEAAKLSADDESSCDASGTRRSLSQSGPPAPMQRLVARDLPFHQSSNSLRVRHQASDRTKHHQHALIFPLRFFHWYIEDWFHVLLRLRTLVSVVMLVAVWTCFLLIFAGIYRGIDLNEPDVDCGLGDPGEPIGFHGAFAFSLETTTTVGFGLPNGSNGFFEQCPELQVAVYFQMLISMFFNAFLLSFMFARLARCEARAAQVLFSDKAIINREVLPNGIVRYMLSARVYDADSMYPIVEAHVRFYAVKHRSMHHDENRGVRYPLKFEPMRVSVPNDDLGAVLYTSIPTRAMHHIDYHSPILPPSIRKLGAEDGRVKGEFVMDHCGLSLRENDSYTGSQDGLRCVICGETYGTVANLVQHIRYNQHMEKHDDVPVAGSHQELDVDALFKDRRPSRKVARKNTGGNTDTRIDIDKPASPWYQEYEQYMRESNLEIICVMEAIDPIMSGTFGACQSYTMDDIIFDAEFAPCVLSDPVTKQSQLRLRCTRWLRRIFVGRSAVGRSVKVDLDTFHETVKVGEG